MKNIHFIINPQAKNGYSQKVWKDIEEELQLGKHPYLAYFTKQRGHATQIAREIAAKVAEERIVIAVIGGDGTLHEVVNGVIGYKNVALGFIPAGSGNDFGRGFQFPKKPLLAYRTMTERLNLDPVFVDIGKIVDSHSKQTCFVNNMGAGFDALITKEANNSHLKKILNRFSLGGLIYAYLVIKKLFTYKRTDVLITIDEKSYHYKDTWFVTVSNQQYYGGGMKIAPEASVIDGNLDVTVVHRLSRLKFLLVFVSVFWGGHVKFKEVDTFQGKYITLESNEPLYVHADGENIGETPVKVRADYRVLPLLSKGIDYEST